MYNNEIKERYLLERESEYTDIRKAAQEFFSLSEKYENQFGKDCCNFSAIEISVMYTGYMSRSSSTIRIINNQLGVYTDWCIKNNLVDDNTNHYHELRYDKHFANRCINYDFVNLMVISRGELLKILPKMINISDAVLALAIFEGISGKKFSDFYKLTMDKFDGNVVKLPGREIVVSNKLVELAEQSSKTYDKYGNNKIIKNGYDTSDLSIVKFSCNTREDHSEERNKRMIQTRLYKLEDEFGHAFSYAGLRNSGRIHLIKTMMKETRESDIVKLIMDNRDDFENRYGRFQSVSGWVFDNQRFLVQ